MTTTVTLTTHDWPCLVETVDQFESPEREYFARTRETVPPNTTQQFYLTDTRQVFFTELPKPTVEETKDAA